MKPLAILRLLALSGPLALSGCGSNPPEVGTAEVTPDPTAKPAPPPSAPVAPEGAPKAQPKD